MSLIEIATIEQLQFSVVQKNCFKEVSIPGTGELASLFLKIINDGFNIKSISHENLESFTTHCIIHQVSAEGKNSLLLRKSCKYASLSQL